MKTLNGKTIEVGMKVYLLQVPVLRQHTFKVGTVVRLTEKCIHVEYDRRDSRYSREDNVDVVKRYPDQLIYAEEFS